MSEILLLTVSQPARQTDRRSWFRRTLWSAGRVLYNSLPSWVKFFWLISRLWFFKVKMRIDEQTGRQARFAICIFLFKKFFYVLKNKIEHESRTRASHEDIIAWESSTCSFSEKLLFKVKELRYTLFYKNVVIRKYY